MTNKTKTPDLFTLIVTAMRRLREENKEND